MLSQTRHRGVGLTSLGRACLQVRDCLCGTSVVCEGLSLWDLCVCEGLSLWDLCGM